MIDVDHLHSSISGNHVSAIWEMSDKGDLIMSMSELSIWVRDTAHPCLPYQSTAHNWISAIFTCDLQPLSFGAVKNGIFPLTDTGNGGGRVHGQVRVPPGCYIVVAFATCKNVLTDMAFVQVGCRETACVNLITKRLSTCTGQLIVALKVGQVLGAKYSASSPPGEQIPPEVIANATKALEELRKHLPWDPVLGAFPVSEDELIEMAKEEKNGGRKGKSKKD